MARQVTVGELVHWILDNRSKITWRDCSEEDIAEEVLWCAKHNTLCYSLDDKEKLNGVTCAKLDKENKIFHVRNILSTESVALKNMIRWLILTYPDYSIEGYARGIRKRKFNPITLLRRLK